MYIHAHLVCSCPDPFLFVLATKVNICSITEVGCRGCDDDTHLGLRWEKSKGGGAESGQGQRAGTRPRRRLQANVGIWSPRVKIVDTGRKARSVLSQIFGMER